MRFTYGEIVPKGKVIHEYEPDRVLVKTYFKKYNVMIEADSLKEAKIIVKNMFQKGGGE